jgi:hypothetical protein
MEAVSVNAVSVRTTMAVPIVRVVAAGVKAIHVHSAQLKKLYPSWRILSPLTNLQSTPSSRIGPIIFGIGRMEWYMGCMARRVVREARSMNKILDRPK